MLGFPDDHGLIDAPSFHPMFRIGPYGNLITDMVVELVETHIDTGDLSIGPYPFRSGVTLLIWQEYLQKGVREDPKIHYVIPKHRSAEREKRQQMYFAAMPRAGRHDEHAHREVTAKPSQIESAWRIDFGLVHAGL
jgi:hypothetical protein